MDLPEADWGCWAAGPVAACPLPSAVQSPSGGSQHHCPPAAPPPLWSLHHPPLHREVQSLCLHENKGFGIGKRLYSEEHSYTNCKVKKRKKKNTISNIHTEKDWISSHIRLNILFKRSFYGLFAFYRWSVRIVDEWEPRSPSILQTETRILLFFFFFLNPQANIFHTGILVFSGFICVSYPLIQFPLLWSFCSSKYCYSQPVSHAKHHNRCLTNLNTSLQKILSVL